MVDERVMMNNIVKGLGRLAKDRSNKGLAKLVYALTYAKLWADIRSDPLVYRIMSRELRGVIYGNEKLVDDWTVVYAYIDDINGRIDLAKEVANRYMKYGVVCKAKALVLFKKLGLCNKIMYAIHKNKFKLELNRCVEGDLNDVRRAAIAILYARIAAKGDDKFQKYLVEKRKEVMERLGDRKDIVLFRITGETKYLSSDADIQKYWTWFCWS